MLPGQLLGRVAIYFHRHKITPLIQEHYTEAVDTECKHVKDHQILSDL